MVGFPRSGTTLLRAMLHGHPEIVILPEPRWLVSLLKAHTRSPLGPVQATRWLHERVHPDWYALAEMSPADVAPQLPDRAVSAPELVDAIGRTYALRSGKPRWGLKNPGADFRRALPLVRDSFPGASFVFLARDPRDVYLSQVGAGWRSGNDDLELFCLLWGIQARRMLRDLAPAGTRMLVLRYEDLVEDPERSLRELCRVANLADSPAALHEMLAFSGRLQGRVTDNPIHGNLAGPVLAANRRKFETKLPPDRIRRAAVAAGPALTGLGYPREGAAGRIEEWRERLEVVLGAGRRLLLHVPAALRGRGTLSGVRRKVAG
ncbi:MAG: sulfotransferase [Gemmatimonadetes bacterium]|nr:sulfotransferase [Gemmatimonadota bacterium]